MTPKSGSFRFWRDGRVGSGRGSVIVKWGTFFSWNTKKTGGKCADFSEFQLDREMGHFFSLKREENWKKVGDFGQREPAHDDMFGRPSHFKTIQDGA